MRCILVVLDCMGRLSTFLNGVIAMDESAQRVYARPGFYVPFDPDSRDPKDMIAAECGNHPQAGLNYHQWLVGQISGPVLAEFLRAGGHVEQLEQTALVVHLFARILATCPNDFDELGKAVQRGTA